MNVQSARFTYQSVVAPPQQSELDDLRDRLGKSVVEAMQEMATLEDYVKRNYKNDRKYLHTGHWYPQDYVKALTEMGELELLEVLRNNGDLIAGREDSRYFDPIMDNVNGKPTRRNWAAIAKKDKLPSFALKVSMLGFSIADCGSVCQKARYKALLDILGEAKFNRLFSPPHGQPINIGYMVDDDLQPMRHFVSFTDVTY